MDKNALFGYFCAQNFKSYSYIWNQYLQICLIAKFSEETKMAKFCTKNALLGYFSQKMAYLGIFVQDFWKNYSHIWSHTLEFV